MRNLIFGMGLLAVVSMSAQENFVYTEAGGSGPMLSINYEGTLIKETNWTYKIGYGYASAFEEYHTLPLGVNHLTAIERGNYFELGLGYTHVFKTKSNQDIKGFIVPNAGIRIFDGSRRFFFRFTVNPLIILDDTTRLFPWGGFSMGIRL